MVVQICFFNCNIKPLLLLLLKDQLVFDSHCQGVGGEGGVASGGDSHGLQMWKEKPEMFFPHYVSKFSQYSIKETKQIF